MTRRHHLAATGELASQLAEIGSALTSVHDERADADRMVRFAGRVLPSSRHCGLTLIRGGHRPRTMASSDAIPEQVDLLQYDMGEGPCLDAATDGVELSGYLRTDQRWPAFGPRCVERTGVQSMLSVRLGVTGRDFAALNFYSRERGAFGEEDVDTATLLAPYASLAVEHALRLQDTTNFEAALSSSRQIGTAIGIVMARRLVTSQEAFELLRAASQDLNRKLREVAAEVEQTGELPAPRNGGAASESHQAVLPHPEEQAVTRDVGPTQVEATGVPAHLAPRRAPAEHG